MDLDRHPAAHATRRTSRCALALAGLLGLAAAALPSRAAELVLAVSQQTALSLPFNVAEAQGFFAAENVAVKTVGCVGGARCFEQLLAGTAQLATASELPVVMGSFKRRDFAIVATVVTSTRNIKILARRSAGVDTATDLLGKRVGVLPNTSSHYMLDAYLLFHGIDPAKVTLVRLSNEGIGQALVRGEVDVIAAYNQQVAPTAKALGADAVVLKDPRIYTETFNLIADRATLARRGDEVVKVLRALERAERFIAAEPAQAKKILLARTPYDAVFLDTIFPDYRFRLSLEQSLIGTMEGQARWAVREGHVPAGQTIPNYLDFIEAAPLRLAVPGALSK